MSEPNAVSAVSNEMLGAALRDALDQLRVDTDACRAELETLRGKIYPSTEDHSSERQLLLRLNRLQDDLIAIGRVTELAARMQAAQQSTS